MPCLLLHCFCFSPFRLGCLKKKSSICPYSSFCCVHSQTLLQVSFAFVTLKAFSLEATSLEMGIHGIWNVLTSCFPFLFQGQIKSLLPFLQTSYYNGLCIGNDMKRGGLPCHPESCLGERHLDLIQKLFSIPQSVDHKGTVGCRVYFGSSICLFFI